MKSLILFVLAVSAFGTLVMLRTAITDPTVPFYLPLGFLAMFAGSLWPHQRLSS